MPAVSPLFSRSTPSGPSSSSSLTIGPPWRSLGRSMASRWVATASPRLYRSTPSRRGRSAATIRLRMVLSRFFQLDKGVEKTRQTFFDRISGLFARDVVDEDLWGELEE